MNVDTEKQSKVEQAENKVKVLEDQFEDFQEAVLKKFNALKDNVI